tara:strand:+ start:5970 stop:7193 length:1224 start_codon:yes stop_codon:yes gene_type:complete
LRALYIISNPFYYTNNPVGGSISSGTGVINGLSELGYLVDIISDDKLPTIKGNQRIKYLYFRKLLIREVIQNFRRIFPNRLINLLESIFFRFVIKIDIKRILSEQNYDLVYIRASHFAGDALEVVKTFGTPSILEVNKPLSMQNYNKPQGFEGLNENERKIKKIANEIKQYENTIMISTDSNLRGRWITKYVDPKYRRKILINHNGVNEKLFKPTSKVDISSNGIIGMASSFRWYNDIDELMRIIKKVRDSKQDVEFRLFIGDKSKHDEIESKINENGLNDSINTFYSIPLDQMPEKLGECDLLISHFNFHGVWPHNCSIKHLEYMAMGKAVIATNVGEVNFAIKHNISGLLVDESDEDKFANEILRLLQDTTLARNLGNQARNQIVSSHTWKQHVERSLNFLKHQT